MPEVHVEASFSPGDDEPSGRQGASFLGSAIFSFLRSAPLLVSFLTLFSGGLASAQDAFPTRTVRLIVPFAAGGAGDAVARVTAFYMQKAMGVSVVVENRAGAGGITGTDSVAKAIPDGYTLCVCSTGPISVATWTERLPYDPLKDLAPISVINTFPLVLLVTPSLEVSSAGELVKLSQQRPGGLSYSTIGAGGLVAFSAEIFRLQTKANLTAVPYRGGALATAAVVSGEVQLTFANMSDAVAQVEAKTVKALAVTSAVRNEHLPHVPTLIELGLVDHPVESWNGLFAPAGPPQPIIDRLAKLTA